MMVSDYDEETLILRKKLQEKEETICMKDTQIRHLTSLIEFQKSEMEDYELLISFVNKQKRIIEEKCLLVDKLKEDKVILISEMENIIEEYVEEQQKVAKLTDEIITLRKVSKEALDKYETCKSLFESLSSCENTVAEEQSSLICSNKRESITELHTKCEELLTIVDSKNNEIENLLLEIEFLRDNKDNLYSEISKLKFELEGLYNENSYLKVLSQSSFSPDSFMNLQYVHHQEPIPVNHSKSIAIEIPEIFLSETQLVPNVEEEYYKKRNKELEEELKRYKMQLQEALDAVDKIKFENNCEFSEDATQSSLNSVYDNNRSLIIKEIEEKYQKEINRLMLELNLVNQKIVKKENNNKGKGRNIESPNSKNPFLKIFYFFFYNIKSSFDIILKKLRLSK
uniref:HAP1 N-terminal domain-containing protein n=1 Tax=Parastrongyloides trichosuri TaxID=131310 RepID=A0A0N4ZCY9_PARTI